MLKLSYIIQGMTIIKVYTSQILTIIILHYSYLAINTNQTSPLLYYITIDIITIQIISMLPYFFFVILDQYWNGAFVNQPSQEASIVYARRHRHLPLPLPLRTTTPHVNEKFSSFF